VTLEEFVEESRVYFEDCHELLVEKNRDYQRGGDPFGGIRVAAKRAGTTPQQVLYLYAQKHLQAIENWMATGSMNTDDPPRRFMDLSNLFAIMCLMAGEDQLNADADTILEDHKAQTGMPPYGHPDSHTGLSGD
jgi:hypothetical protein